METGSTFGAVLRDWRARRRRSQLDLAGETPLSQRHLSFLESGRSRPSRETVGRLARALDLPPRAANELYLAAGFAPAHPSHGPDAPEIAAIRDAARAIIMAADPCPALVVDRRWRLVEANAAARRLMADLPPDLMAPPVNVLRASLHPEGLARRILNFREWRAHLAARLTRDAELSGDAGLIALREELMAFPVPPGARPGPAAKPGGAAALPLSLATPLGALDLLSATTVFGTAVEVTASELVIESFWPAAETDREILARMAGA